MEFSVGVPSGITLEYANSPLNGTAPRPIWTPLIQQSMPKEQVEQFGQAVPMQRTGQPDEFASTYTRSQETLSERVCLHAWPLDGQAVHEPRSVLPGYPPIQQGER
jgi:NAD(P)-dependent dehydrogenase (short-subunit alcohol dehydrogenase family)